MFGKIAIRNIPPEIWSGLETLAGEHDRSVEAEARFALRSWVQPLMQRNVQSARRAEVGARLTEVLDQVNRVRHASFIRPSHIAQSIGEDRAEHVENWFISNEEPSFRQLADVASYLGCSAAWLQHGDGKMFPVASHRLAEDSEGAVRWFLDLNEEKPVSFLHLIREESEAGELLVVKQYDDWHCTTWTTPIHVSEVIGAGGERALAALSVALQLLYEFYTSSRGSGLIVKSYLLSAEDSKTLRSGAIHPLVALRGAQECPWWEDFWDIEQFRKHSNYWPGWRKLCERILRAVELSSGLAEQREQVLRKQHPLLERTE
ncbi:FitA-like ribbon-helix-helix domain-containing protein [Paraburkholderia tropica]|uniref:FitA-like ribbon-helix-helix domain-containing protein n=1 Tax=Paraburkholderia tropica TaxID=92647 RepID=UPI002ABE6684|nr:hypothetical protein [Paraburkholderia tropica]